MHSLRKHTANEQGGTLVLMAVTLTALLSMLALAIDLGMLFTARGEAQRVADAAAHAGAIEFWKKPDNPASVVTVARDSALFVANRNTVRNTSVVITGASSTWKGDTLRTVFAEGVVDVIRAEQKVRVTIRRTGISTWFARMFGVNTAAVGARSAAAVRYANEATCVKPFAIPDLWADYNRDGVVTNQTSNEYYRRFDRNATAVPAETGWGSAFRNSITDEVGRTITNDYGRMVTLRQSGSGGSNLIPSMYFAWELPAHPELFQQKCPGGSAGSSTYRLNICHCNKNQIQLGTTYSTSTGATVGDTKFGLDDLIQQDPNATWDATKGEVVNSDPKFGHWTRSPRVAIVPLFDPRQLLSEGNLKSGKQPIVFNNFATVFIEKRPPGQGQNDDIYGRFLPFARGTGRGSAPGPATGSLVRMLQIVE